MFTKIPDALAGMARDDLITLARTVNAEIRKALSDSPDADTKAAAKDASEGVARITAHLADEKETAALAAAAAASDDKLDEFMRSEDVIPLSDPDGPDVVEGEPTPIEDVEDDKTDEKAKPTAKTAANKADEKKDAADTGGATFTGAQGGNVAGDPDPSGTPAAKPSHFVATANATGVGLGHKFSDGASLAEALIATAEQMGENPTGKVTVAQMQARFSDAQKHVEGDDAANFKRFQSEELLAALCAPATPLYDMACESSMARPVKASLPTLEATRGKVTVYPSPTLADIGANDVDNAVGIWTSADDSNPASIKGYAEIVCGTPVAYEIYGVYKHLRAPELLLRTFPELVDAYLNKLGALHSRIGEIQLLNSMATGTIALTDPAPSAYGATVSIMRRLLILLALRRDTERWPDDQPMDVYLPRWTLMGMVIDLISRNMSQMTSTITLATEATIRRLFAEAGFNLIPFMDNATWSIANNAVATTGALSALPTSAKILVTPPGKYAVMDRGDFSVGVAGAPARDSETIKTNRAVFFYENFEGLVNTDTCPAYTLTIDALRFTGQQVADITLTSLGAEPVA